jgi:hypothetical protein
MRSPSITPMAHMTRLTSDKLLRWIIGITMISLVIDAGGQTGLRTIFPIGLFLIFLLKRRKIAPLPHGLLLFSLLVAYPTCLYFIGLLRNGNPEVAVSQYRSTLFSWLMMIALSGINYAFLARTLYSSLALTAFLATIGAAALFLGIPVIDNFFGALTGGYFGLRGVGESFIPNLQFRSTLFFVPAALYFLLNRKLLLYCVCVLGLVAGVSKAGLAFVLVASLLFVIGDGGKTRWLVLAVAMLFVLFLYNSPIGELFVEIATGDSRTLEVRQRDLESIAQLFFGDPVGFIFGFGMGSEFYSEGAGDFVTGIELDHLNTIRKYGIIWSGFFFYFVIATSVRAILSPLSEVRILGICLLSAFIVAGTNPVLISPIFFLVLFIATQAENQTHAGRRRDPLLGAPYDMRRPASTQS